MHSESDVSGQRPGRGGPGQDRCLRIFLEPESDVDARVWDVVAVALGELVAREGRGTARAVGRNTKSLVDEPLLPHLAERPPDRLDVVGRERPVRVVVVLPER